MISVDEHRTVQSDFEHDSLGIRDCGTSGVWDTAYVGCI